MIVASAFTLLACTFGAAASNDGEVMFDLDCRPMQPIRCTEVKTTKAKQILPVETLGKHAAWGRFCRVDEPTRCASSALVFDTQWHQSDVALSPRLAEPLGMIAERDTAFLHGPDLHIDVWLANETSNVFLRGRAGLVGSMADRMDVIEHASRAPGKRLSMVGPAMTARLGLSLLPEGVFHYCPGLVALQNLIGFSMEGPAPKCPETEDGGNEQTAGDGVGAKIEL